MTDFFSSLLILLGHKKLGSDATNIAGMLKENDAETFRCSRCERGL